MVRQHQSSSSATTAQTVALTGLEEPQSPTETASRGALGQCFRSVLVVGRQLRRVHCVLPSRHPNSFTACGFAFKATTIRYTIVLQCLPRWLRDRIVQLQSCNLNRTLPRALYHILLKTTRYPNRSPKLQCAVYLSTRTTLSCGTLFSALFCFSNSAFLRPSQPR